MLLQRVSSLTAKFPCVDDNEDTKRHLHSLHHVAEQGDGVCEGCGEVQAAQRQGGGAGTRVLRQHVP